MKCRVTAFILSLCVSVSAQVFSPEIIGSLTAPSSGSTIDTNGLVIYMDADTVTADGYGDNVGVGRWISSVIASHPALTHLRFTNSTSSAQWPTNTLNVVNGHNALRYNGGQQLFNSTNIDQTNFFISAYTLLISLRADPPGNNYVPISFGTGPLTAAFSDGNIYADLPASARISTSAGGSRWTNNWNVVEVHRNGTSGSIWLNGDQKNFVNGTLSGNASGTTAPDIGGNSGSSLFKGYIRRILVYNSDKGTNADWGITRTNIMNDVGL